VENMNRSRVTGGIFKELLQYKSALIGLVLLMFLLIISTYAIFIYPGSKAVVYWRAGENMWIKNPKNALPEWWELFTPGKTLPRTIEINPNAKGYAMETLKTTNDGGYFINLSLSFNYEYDEEPSAINVFVNGTPGDNFALFWVYPDGRKIFLTNLTLTTESTNYYLSQDIALNTRLEMDLYKQIGKPEYSPTIEKILFGTLSREFKVQKGMFKLLVQGYVKDPKKTSFDLVVYGKVYGIAGTDHLRRPLEIAILYGTPIALAFGLTASVLISVIELVIGVISGYFGGALDTIIQRITEIYMIIPFLNIVILISVFYKLDLWTLLGIIIILSIFGSGIKSTRAMALQIKELPYVEAAKAYGASDWRIVFIYMIPKILPTLVPSIVLSVPGFVFLEAALSLLGLGDPLLPTWGKVLSDAESQGALYKGLYYWVLEPSFMLILTSISFTLIGFALDRIVNPRLKEM
jgi:peptide/nickel transport system permease protein